MFILPHLLLAVLLIKENQPAGAVGIIHQHLLRFFHLFVKITVIGESFGGDFKVQRFILSGKRLPDWHYQSVVLHFVDLIHAAYLDVLTFLCASAGGKFLDASLVLKGKFALCVFSCFIPPEEAFKVSMGAPGNLGARLPHGIGSVKEDTGLVIVV